MKHITELPLETIVQAAAKATRKAALDAVTAGRVVTGLKDRQLSNTNRQTH